MPIPKPKLDADVEEFYKQLVEKGDLKPEELDLLHSLLSNEKVATEFKTGVHARRLTDRKLDEFKNEKNKLEGQVTKKLEELEQLKTSLASTSTMTQKQINDLQEAKRRVEAQLVNVVQTARDKYSNGDEFLASVGLTQDVISAFGSGNQPPPTQPQFNKDDLIKEIEKSISGRVDNNALAVTDFNIFLHQARDEYEELTGKKLNVAEFKAAVLEDGTGNYQDVYNKKYDIPRLKEEKQRESMKTEIEKQIRDEYEQKYSSRGLPGSQIPQESAFFNAIDSAKPKEEQVNNVPMGIADRNGTLGEAVQMFSKLKEKRDAAEAA